MQMNIRLNSLRIKSIIPSLSFGFSLQYHNAISPLDGRYQKQTSELNRYFSEAALMKYRVKV